MTTAIHPGIAQYIKENTQLTGTNVALMCLATAIVSLVVYATGLLNLHDTLGSAAIAMIALLLSDRLNLGIFLRTLPVQDPAVLQRAHRRVSLMFALAAVPLSGLVILWDGAAQTGLEKTGVDLLTMLAGVSLICAIRIRKPDQSRLAQILDLLKSLASTIQPGH